MATSTAMKEWEKKYAKQIEGLAKANNVDMSTASNMLQANLTEGAKTGSYYKGGGSIDSVRAASELRSAQMQVPDTRRTPRYYEDQLAQANLLAQQEAEKAAKLRTQQAVSKVESYIPQVEQETQRQLQEAYIASQRARAQAPQALSALGYTGGAAESSLMGLESDYLNRRQALEQAQTQSLSQLRQNIADIQASGNADLADLASQYYNQLLSIQQQQMSEQAAQDRWQQEFDAQQAAQMGTQTGTPLGTQTGARPVAPQPDVDYNKVNSYISQVQRSIGYGANQSYIIDYVRNLYNTNQITYPEAQTILGGFGYSLT